MKNSRPPVRPHVVFAALLFGLLLGACTRPALTPQRVRPPEPSLVLEQATATALAPTTPPLPEGYGAPPSPLPSASPRPYVPPPTPEPLLTTFPLPSPTFGPTPTPFPTYPPPPTLIPTFDPTTLPDQLRAALALRTEDGVNGYSLQKVTGWEDGFRLSNYCADGPYRWLDDDHLLLYPIAGEEYFEAAGIALHALPVVTDIGTSQTWLTPASEPLWFCNLPLWSASLRKLIVTTDQSVWVFEPDGKLAQQFPGGATQSFLSPSGRRLLTGTLWRDLETGQTVQWSGRERVPHSRPAWSSDEHRVFDCCFGLGDANTGHYSVFDLGLNIPGRGGPAPGEGTDIWHSKWVLNDERVIPLTVFDAVGMPAFASPLIDPVTQSFQDIRERLAPDTMACYSEGISLNGEWLISACSSPQQNLLYPYLVDLRTFITNTIPSGLSFVSWSPDSQFVLLARNYNSETQSGEYALLPITGGDPYPVSETLIRSPVWSPNGKHLAYLSEDGRALITLESATHASRIVLLPQPSTSVIWSPHGDSLAVLADEGSLWRIPNPGTDYVEQITLPLSNVRDVRWSPSGTHLAFVSGMEVYVVRVTQN